MTAIDARDEAVQGARGLSGPVVSVLSIAGFLLLWFIAAQIADSRLLPGPGAVLTYIYQETLHGDLLTELGITLWRVLASFVVAMAIGSVIGLVMGQMPQLNRFLDPWLIVLLNLPALVIIILAYVWFGLNEAAAIGAVALNKIPNVIVTLREGARALDPGLEEMARAYRLSPMSRLRNVTLPQLQPYFAAASRTGLSLIWKIVLVVELLGRSNGVGFEINMAFQLFDMKLLLAYALPFVALMLGVETLLVQPFERHVTRWRRDFARRRHHA
jgi:NitT/TauT family transport system permease protein